jgi:hypothetical protein
MQESAAGVDKKQRGPALVSARGCVSFLLDAPDIMLESFCMA